ncbi:GGDEF domain-containing protein [Candidatus Marimicrobium litorale]|uniref:diguanylate cyclase n=1 Tax=Candidatus Marimicrobium litorale TaxID=2518991 RepID=A0ABT3T5G4_9GAMM|nr:GGDEF domain-containing protein [Candidatus Marimicrobium litorale]MCX2977533.1 GGDEF domain-containing protein [Candidatus Marimicrobium litorale]
MALHPTALVKLLPLAVLIPGAYFGRGQISLLDDDLRIILDSLPYLLCLGVVLMSLQFQRGRLLLAAISVAVFYWVVQSYLQTSLNRNTDALRAYLALSFALPVMALYLLLLPERGIWNLQGLIAALGFILLGLACIELGPWILGINDAAISYTPNLNDVYMLSKSASILAGLTALVGVVLLCIRNEEIEAALLGAILPVYIALAFLHVEYISVSMCIAASLSLAWGLLRSSYSMAYRDELTGLPGRRALNERLKMLGKSYSIAMIDVDRFKRFNDTYGHEVGDEVLKLVASRVRSIKGGGTAYRYGGEEFCVVFPRKTVEATLEPIEKIRDGIASYNMSIRNRSKRPARMKEGSRLRGATRLGSDQVSITISAGVAARSPEHPDPDSVLSEADKMLYKAKRRGRNRVAYAS